VRFALAVLAVSLWMRGRQRAAGITLAVDAAWTMR